MPLYMRIKLVGGGSYVQPLNELHNAIEGEVEGATVGTRWELELVQMSEDEYEALGEFDGH